MSPANSSPLLRRGVTLLELLVVLLLLGITAALVLPALVPGSAGRPSGAEAVDELVATARRQAIRRAERLTLRVDRDGVWALVSSLDGAVIDGGRIVVRESESARAPTEVTIDALGSCTPSGSGASASTPLRFDPLSCATAVTTPRERGGMTLLESIVAFVVLALVGIACLDLSRGATALQRSSAEWTEAVQVGESALAAAAADAPPGDVATGGTSRATGTGAPQVTRRVWGGSVDVVEVEVALSNGRLFRMHRLVSRRSASGRLAAASAR